MPTPNKGESESDFVSRCHKHLRREEPNLDSKQRSGKCYGIYRTWKKEK